MSEYITMDFVKPEQINVDDLVLRPVPETTEYANIIYDIFSEDVPGMLLWLGGSVYSSPEDVLKIKFGFQYGIFRGDELLGQIVGSAVKSGKTEIGFWLKNSARGHGIINKVLPEIEKMIFAQDWCHKIILQCDVENLSSKFIAIKNNYVLEGTIRQDDKWTDGSLHDNMYFGKLKSEWNNK